MNIKTAVEISRDEIKGIHTRNLRFRAQENRRRNEKNNIKRLDLIKLILNYHRQNYHGPNQNQIVK